jgi:F420H(2)-dependent quinone reductase
MTAAVSRRIPPQPLIDLLNPLVRGVLQSPLHAALDGALLVLHITGRKTGRRYDIPVGYIDLDQQLIVVTQHAWRVNLRGGADIEVTHHGRRQAMHTDLDEDPSRLPPPSTGWSSGSVGRPPNASSESRSRSVVHPASPSWRRPCASTTCQASRSPGAKAPIVGPSWNAAGGRGHSARIVLFFALG